MVPKVFEPLKFYCIFITQSSYKELFIFLLLRRKNIIKLNIFIVSYLHCGGERSKIKEVSADTVPYPKILCLHLRNRTPNCTEPVPGDTESPDTEPELHYVSVTRPRGYKTCFMLNSVEHEILNAHKYKNIKKLGFF